MARNIEHGHSGKTGEAPNSIDNKQQVSILAVISLGTLELHHPLFLEEYLVAYIYIYNTFLEEYNNGGPITQTPTSW